MGTERPACLPPRTRSRREVGGRRSTPNASKWAKLGPGRGGEGELDVDLNLPLIPESQYPILFAAIPSSHARESPSVRRSCCASFLRYRLSVCPSLSALLLSRPPLPSHPKFTMFFAALSSPFPGRLCTYPSILSSRLWAGRRVGGGELTSESSDAAVEREGIWTMKEHRSLCFSTPFGNLTQYWPRDKTFRACLQNLTRLSRNKLRASTAASAHFNNKS